MYNNNMGKYKIFLICFMVSLAFSFSILFSIRLYRNVEEFRVELGSIYGKKIIELPVIYSDFPKNKEYKNLNDSCKIVFNKDSNMLSFKIMSNDTDSGERCFKVFWRYLSDKYLDAYKFYALNGADICENLSSLKSECKKYSLLVDLYFKNRSMTFENRLIYRSGSKFLPIYIVKFLLFISSFLLTFFFLYFVFSRISKNGK